MKINEAISLKIDKICKEKNISINKLATISCLTQITVQHLADKNSKNPKLLTIIRICDGWALKPNATTDIMGPLIRLYKTEVADYANDDNVVNLYAIWREQ